MRAEEVPASEVHFDPQTNQPFDKNQRPVVLVEPENAVQIGPDGKPHYLTYGERRRRWGTLISLGGSSFLPTQFQPNFVAASYQEAYGSPSLPMLELNIAIKRNLSIGSIGIEFGGGYFKVNAKSAISVNGTTTPLDSSLELGQFHLGGQFNLDRLMAEPYVVPYVAGGAYEMYYRESRPATSVSGTTQLAPYLAFGVNLQLDWLDKSDAVIAHQQTRMQSTFIYAEARTLVASSSAKDPHLNTALHYNAGIRLEF